MIETKNLTLNYIKEFSALCNINLKIEDKSKIAFIGDSESGKTTLIRSLCGLEKITSGEIYLNNTNLKNINFKKDINLIYVSTNPVFFNNKSVYYNLAYPLKLRGFPQITINQKINRALDNLGIEGLKETKIKNLNNNEKQIVNIARSLTREAEIYLIDDIFTFDNSTNEKIAQIFTNSLNPDAIIVYALDSQKEYLTKYLKINKIYKINHGVLES